MRNYIYVRKSYIGIGNSMKCNGCGQEVQTALIYEGGTMLCMDCDYDVRHGKEVHCDNGYIIRGDTNDKTRNTTGT
jgi:hypothetical protein